MKQVILVRQDLKLPKGKLAAQVAHASVQGYRKANWMSKRVWLAGGMKKVVLKVVDLAELQKYAREARKEKLPTALISDAGKTTVAPGTITCLGIGPADEKAIDVVTGSLKML
jgi:PTH2 family peptidyl-tRNA hydrolase